MLMLGFALAAYFLFAKDGGWSGPRKSPHLDWELSRSTFNAPELGQYSFQPGPNVQFSNDRQVELTAVAVVTDHAIRWMMKSDDGTLPDGTRTVHVILDLQTVGSIGEPFSYVVPPFEALRLDGQTRQDSLLIIPNTKDFRGLPLRMTCHFGARERKTLESFGTLPGMQQGYCRFMGYVRPDVLLTIQPFPVDLLGDAHLLLPPFFVAVSNSLVRRK
jgi:hypothetical protein